MILKIYEQFGVEAFHILKKYENKNIYICKYTFQSSEFVQSFCLIFGDKAISFFKQNCTGRLCVKNAEKTLKRFLKKKMQDDFFKITTSHF